MDFILSHRDNVRAAKIGPKKVQKNGRVWTGYFKSWSVFSGGLTHFFNAETYI